jgi:hypothetical protein
MTAVGNDHLVAVVQVRLGVVGDGRRLGERSEDVEGRQGACGVLDARRLGSHATSQVLEDLQLALEDPLVCAEHLGLVLFECRRREPLAAGDGLLSADSRRGGVKVRFRDLDVVTEHTIEADLQRSDAGARALALFHVGDHLAGRIG